MRGARRFAAASAVAMRKPQIGLADFVADGTAQATAEKGISAHGLLLFARSNQSLHYRCADSRADRTVEGRDFGTRMRRRQVLYGGAMCRLAH